MAVQWAQEACDRLYDPQSGARIFQLTSAACVSNNVYGEQPYTTPDGRRVAILRKRDFSFDPSAALIVGELPTLKIALVERDGVTGVCNAAWSGILYYGTERGELVRLDMTTFDRQVIHIGQDPIAREGASSASPDQRYLITRALLPGPTIGVVRCDLQERRREIIFQHPEIINPHLQFNPVHGRQVLVQHNRGSRMAPDGTPIKWLGEPGTTLFVIDSDGTNQQPLPVGAPHTSGSTGHECFVADTGLVLFSTAWNWNDWSLDSRYPEGNLFLAAPGDAKPTLIPAPEHRFNHVSASRCGRYWLADSHPLGGLYDQTRNLQRVRLVVGSVQSGRHRVLVSDTLGSGGGNQSTHSHPYFTADNRFVVYNADPYYAPGQVFAAEVPEGFLSSLD